MDKTQRASELEKEYDPTKNVLPFNKIAKSRKYWWIGSKCGHNWEASYANRERLGAGCPYCAGSKTLKGFNSFSIKYPDKAKLFHPSKNDVEVDDIPMSSKEEYWWLEDCGHEYKATLERKGRLSKCQVCINRIIVPGINDLATLRPDLASEWDFDKNILAPTEVSTGKNINVWWICPRNHSWYGNINERNSRSLQCKICASPIKGETDLFTTDPHLINKWDWKKNNEIGLNPYELSFGSEKVAYWKDECGHSFDMSIALRTNKMKCGCPYCAGHRILGGLNDLASRFPEVAKDWDWDKNESDPYNVNFGSNEKAYWICHKCGYQWHTYIANRTRGKRSCQKCSFGKKSSDGEKELLLFLTEKLQLKIETNNRAIIPNKLGNDYLEIDSLCRDLNIAFEYNGNYYHSNKFMLKHSKRKSDFSSIEEFHQYKVDKCKEAGIDLVFVWEDQWIDNNEQARKDIENFVRIGEKSEQLTRLTSILDTKDKKGEK